jgi:DNA polymerase-3 subunit alpha
MSSEPLIDVIPIMRREQDGQVITQFDYPSCEKLGLVKMDFLGLRNLTILDDAIANVKANRGEDIDLDELSKDMTDKATYELLARGDTLGVFQLDGGGMRTLLRLMQPDNFEDISAALALYRPGPRWAPTPTPTTPCARTASSRSSRSTRSSRASCNRRWWRPSTDPRPTYGLVIYQEQVHGDRPEAGGYTLGKADLLRRAMGKKKKEVLDAEYVPFSEGMKAKGFNEASIAALWGVLVPFSDYAFNKAHTAAYGLVSYWTAYLKANYPAEYMAALLTSVGDDKDKSALYLNECRHMGIKVLPPDVNSSVGASRPSAPTSASGCRRSATSGTTSSTSDHRRPRGEGGLHLVRGLPPSAGRSWQQADHRVAHQGRCLRRPRREAAGLLRVHEEYVDASSRSRSRRRSGRTASSAPSATTPGAAETDMSA